MSFSMIYCTAKNPREAERIAMSLLKERMIGCANIIPKINSLYRWKNKLQKENEALLIAKTRSTLVEKAINKIKAMHSYGIPCVLSLKIDKGNKKFFKWLEEETK